MPGIFGDLFDFNHDGRLDALGTRDGVYGITTNSNTTD